MRTQKFKKGFTLIETMITLTVIGALTALAVPAYQDYTIKSQVAEAFVATEELKKEVELQKTLSDKFNIDLVKITNETLRVDEEGNVFYVFKDTNKAIQNKLVMFYLDENNSNNSVFKWNCLSDLDKKYLPNSVECIIDNDDSNNRLDNDNNYLDSLPRIDSLEDISKNGHLLTYNFNSQKNYQGVNKGPLFLERFININGGSQIGSQRLSISKEGVQFSQLAYGQTKIEKFNYDGPEKILNWLENNSGDFYNTLSNEDKEEIIFQINQYHNY